MNDVVMKRMITSISKWYFLKFYASYFEQSQLTRHNLLTNKDELYKFMYNHYDLVKRTRLVNQNGFEYRFQRMSTLIINYEMHNALDFIIRTSKRKSIIDEALSLDAYRNL